MLNHEILRRCKNGEVNCFAFTGRGCTALTDTDFGDKGCPFYKSREQRAREIAALERRRMHDEA